LLTELISAPDDKSIGIEYCQKISEKVTPIPISILHTKSDFRECHILSSIGAMHRHVYRYIVSY